jgi:hypothetical protein
MAIPQVVVFAALFVWDRPWHGARHRRLLIAQLYAMQVLLRDPKGKAPWYNGTGVTLYVSGMMVTAFAVRTWRAGGMAMTLSWLPDRPPGPRADGAWRDRRADHLDAEPPDGGGAGPARGAAGLLVALHYGIQITRPQWGYKSDTGGHRTRWIIGGMAILALGGCSAPPMASC